MATRKPQSSKPPAGNTTILDLLPKGGPQQQPGNAGGRSGGVAPPPASKPRLSGDAASTTQTATTVPGYRGDIRNFYKSDQKTGGPEVVPQTSAAPVLYRRQGDGQACPQELLPDLQAEEEGGEVAIANVTYRIIQGYVSGVVYDKPDGNQGVIITESEMPVVEDQKEKTAKGKGKKKKKPKSTLFGEEEEEDDDAEANGIDLRKSDDEDDAYLDDDKPEASRTKHGYAADDGFIVEDSDDGKGSEDDDWQDPDERKKKKKKSKKHEHHHHHHEKKEKGEEGEEAKGEDEQEEETKEEATDEDVKVPQAHSDEQLSAVEKKDEDQSMPEQAGDKPASPAPAPTPTPTPAPERKVEKPDTQDLEDIVGSFAIGGDSKKRTRDFQEEDEQQKREEEEKQAAQPAKDEVTTEQPPDASAPPPAPTEELGQASPPVPAPPPPEGCDVIVEVSAGQTHLVEGKLPNCPLFHMVLRVISRPGTQLLKLDKILSIKRTWEAPLTKQKLINKLHGLGLAEKTGPIKAALVGLTCRPTEPLLPGTTSGEALRHVTGKQFGWMCTSALLSDHELKIVSALGLPTYEALHRSPQVWAKIEELLRDKPEMLLFADEVLSSTYVRAGLGDLTYDDYLKLPTPKGTNSLHVVRAAWHAYKALRTSVTAFGDTMTDKQRVTRSLVYLMGAAEAENNAATKRFCDIAVKYLYERGCVAEISGTSDGGVVREHVVLASVYNKELELGREINKKLQDERAARAIPGSALGTERDKILRNVREDLREAVNLVQSSSMCLVDGPDETALFLVSVLKKLSPQSEVCVVTFNAKSRFLPVDTYNFARDSQPFERHLRDAGPPVVVMMNCQYASSNALLWVLEVVPQRSKAILVGDSYGAAPLPKKGEVGRPFLALCELPKHRMPRIVVGSQMEKMGPEAVAEVLLSDKFDPDDAVERAVTDLTEHFEVLADVSMLGPKSAEVYLATSWAGKSRMQTVLQKAGVVAYKNKDVFRRDDLVCVKAGRRRATAGRLVAVNDGYDDLLACSDALRLPLARMGQTANIAGGLPAPGAGGFVAAMGGYRNDEVKVKCEDGCVSGQVDEITSSDRYFLEHLTVANLRALPPFRVNKVCLIISDNTTGRDIYAAAKIAKEKLILLGTTRAAAAALTKMQGPVSALCHILCHGHENAASSPRGERTGTPGPGQRR